MIGILKRAAKERSTLQMIYMDRKGQLSYRYIKPLKVNEHTLIAFCYYKKERRTFKTENILSVLPPKGRNVV